MKKDIFQLFILFLCMGCTANKTPYSTYKDYSQLILIDEIADPEFIRLKELKSNEISHTELVPKNKFSSRTYGSKADNGVFAIYTIYYEEERTNKSTEKVIR